MEALRALRRLDSFQRRRAVVGFPLAVQQKYSDDEGGKLAATIAYYAFFSLFPLLLVFVTILGYVLAGHRHLQTRVIESALGRFPVVGPQLQVHALRGSGLALALGLAGALWAGLAVASAVEDAFDRVWGVPFTRRAGFPMSKLRSLLALLAFGGGVLLSTAAAGVTAYGNRYSGAFTVLGIVLLLVIDFSLFLVAYRVMTSAEVSWRELWPGAAAAAVLWSLLQALGGLYVGHVVAGSSNTYGTFALVIGLLSWIYLGAHITLLCAEANVVLARRLWPRSLSPALGAPDTPADEAALRSRAEVEKRRRDQEIQVEFERDRS